MGQSLERISVGIDGYNLALPNGTGVATYGFTLASLLAAAGHDLTGLFGIDVGRAGALREVRFFDRFGHIPPMTVEQRRARARRLNLVALNPLLKARADDVPLTGRVETAPFAERLPPLKRIASAPDLFDIAYRHFRRYGRFLPVRMAEPPAIMHWTYPVPVELVGARNIYTLHDLVPLKLPYTTLDGKQAYRAIVGQCIARAAHICTVSEASRRDIIAEFAADPAHITNCYQASPAGLAVTSDPAADAAEIAGVFGLPHRGYFLYFGAIEPKKNIGRLIEAFLSTDSTVPLVLVGGRGWRSDEELRLLPTTEDEETERGRRIAARIVRLDHLPRALLLKLIRGARGVLFPSIYEGFGLPVLEAMQLGAPVLTSTASSLPEVAGEAAMLVDPYDTAAIADGIRALDRDPVLRDRLGAAGREQARNFAPSTYLARLQQMYEHVLCTAR
jgi:glycosyltransferase involved in cell wall biosynthesis